MRNLVIVLLLFTVVGLFAVARAAEPIVIPVDCETQVLCDKVVDGKCFRLMIEVNRLEKCAVKGLDMKGLQEAILVGGSDVEQ